jgi:hypothetical protein
MGMSKKADFPGERAEGRYGILDGKNITPDRILGAAMGKEQFPGGTLHRETGKVVLFRRGKLELCPLHGPPRMIGKIHEG